MKIVKAFTFHELAEACARHPEWHIGKSFSTPDGLLNAEVLNIEQDILIDGLTELTLTPMEHTLPSGRVFTSQVLCTKPPLELEHVPKTFVASVGNDDVIVAFPMGYDKALLQLKGKQGSEMALSTTHLSTASLTLLATQLAYIAWLTSLHQTPTSGTQTS